MIKDRIYRPGAVVVLGFGLMIVLGTLLLSLPISHRQSVTLLDSLFTAASAVTVTGLAVVNTGSAWTPFGELVILFLIQIGGLGILTMAGFFGIALNRRLGIRSGLLAGAEIGLSDLGVLRTLIRDIVRFVAATEILVAFLLTIRFLSEGGHGAAKSLHLAVFHSVSAFNNAGFSIFTDGLESRTGDWFVSLVVAFTFILGGLGFPVVFELQRRWRKPSTWTLHTKATLATTAVLLAAGTVVIGALEWSNPATIGDRPPDERVLAAFFQSATARTAGFNTVPIGSLRSSSWLILVLFMFVGASSASTGGGIKTSTLAVVVRSTLAELRGDSITTMFSREITLNQQRQSLALVIAALGTVGTASFVLSIVDGGLPAFQLLFEAASAFGTVGLTTGVTTELGQLGRLVVIGLMFVGRVGPITFGTAVLLRGQRRQYGYAEEELIVG
jgi:potassium uptake TrkH family protein